MFIIQIPSQSFPNRNFLLLPLCRFSTLANHYFEINFELKVNLYTANINIVEPPLTRAPPPPPPPPIKHKASDDFPPPDRVLIHTLYSY